MKKIIYLFIVLIPVVLTAQTKFGTIKAGLFTPSATEAGFILGYEGGWIIDDNFFVGWSADWFNKNYTDRNLVNEFNDFYGQINSQLNELRAKTNLHSIPLMGTVTGNWEVAPRARAFVTAGAGLDILLIFYRNYANPDNNEFQGAFDFAWRLGGGVMYELGRRSDAFIELAYHNSQPGWEYEVKDALTGRTKVFERRFDMSGLLMRVGFRFYF
jgi:hypothetical protein